MRRSWGNIFSEKNGRVQINGIVFNIQRFSLDDGPGIRTTVFLKGCPLKCLWCSNPESQNAQPEVAHRDSVCNKCGHCVEICDANAISIDDSGVYIDRKRCTNCGKCVEVCSPEALKIFGNMMSVEEVLREIRKDVQYYQNSGGGITLSGGEPLSQPDFALELLKRCHNEGFHTCLDTTGDGSAAALREILKYTLLVLYDVKSFDPVIHRQLTGRANKRILSNLKLVLAKGTPLIVRVPLVSGLNNSEQEITAIAGTVAAMDSRLQVNLLPYHRYGVAKYQQLDREYKLGDLERPSEEETQRSKEIVESFGLQCKIVG